MSTWKKYRLDAPYILTDSGLDFVMEPMVSRFIRVFGVAPTGLLSAPKIKAALCHSTYKVGSRDIAFQESLALYFLSSSFSRSYLHVNQL